jgi:hypothetical protein
MCPFQRTGPFTNRPERFTNRHLFERTQLFNAYIYIYIYIYNRCQWIKNETRERNHLSRHLSHCLNSTPMVCSLDGNSTMPAQNSSNSRMQPPCFKKWLTAYLYILDDNPVRCCIKSNIYFKIKLNIIWRRWDIIYFLAKFDLRWKIIDTNTIRMEKN